MNLFGQGGLTQSNISNLFKSKGAHEKQELKKSQKLTDFERSQFDEIIQKGDISSEIINSYGGETKLTFDKTGKEIREKIPSIIASLEAQKNSLEAQMGIYKAQAGIEPDEVRESYRIKTISCPRYSYGLSEPKYDRESGSYEETTAQNIACSKYNAASYMWFGIAEDIEMIKVIEANLVDSKKYTLSVNQLIALNFK
jgi:hypothetical protein